MIIVPMYIVVCAYVVEYSIGRGGCPLGVITPPSGICRHLTATRLNYV